MATLISYRIDLGTVGTLKRTLVLVLGGLAMLGAGTPDAYAVMVRQFVQDAESRGAVCNDGTPAAYFIQPGSGTGANRWIVHLEGGGAGGSLEKLELRWVTARRLMSTASIDLLVPGAGIFSQSASNYFGSWNHVLVNYCSSDYFTGDGVAERPAERIDPTGPDHWEFRGKRIVRAVLEDLRTPVVPAISSLDDANEVIFSGGSAGSWGAQQSADEVSAFVASVTSGRARFAVIGDAGWEPISRTAKRDEDSFEERSTALWNSQLDTSCIADHPERPYLCLENFVAAEYIEAPLFIVMDLLDCNVLTTRGIDLGAVEGDDVMKVARISSSINGNLHDFLARHPAVGAYVNNRGWHTALRNSFRFFEAGIQQANGRRTLHDTLVSWYADDSARTTIFDESPPLDLTGLCD